MVLASRASRRDCAVNESEWLSYPDASPMLAFLGKQSSGRKLRLFTYACCRSAWALLDDPTRIMYDSYDIGWLDEVETWRA